MGPAGRPPDNGGFDQDARRAEKSRLRKHARPGAQTQASHQSDLRLFTQSQSHPAHPGRTGEALGAEGQRSRGVEWSILLKMTNDK